ncbi:hypothetical protein GQ53DRAFT_818054 [Thozetella sp. PMI_491]|nr:hypothetical protein GQ53DRAFT_818054 [Thozetella sp. PMI_491]
MVCPALPPEIWLQIFEHLRTKPHYRSGRKVLASLCHVSRLFDKIARPLVYQEFSISSDPVAPFVRTILARPDLAELSTRLKVSYGWNRLHLAFPLTEQDISQLTSKASEVGLAIPDGQDVTGWKRKHSGDNWTTASPTYEPLIMLLIRLLPNLYHIRSNEYDYRLLDTLPPGSYLTRLQSVDMSCHDTGFGFDPSEEQLMPLWKAPNLESVSLSWHRETSRHMPFQSLRKLQLRDSILHKDGEDLAKLLGPYSRLETFLFSSEDRNSYDGLEARPRQIAVGLRKTAAAETLRFLALDTSRQCFPHHTLSVMTDWEDREDALEEEFEEEMAEADPNLPRPSEETRCGVGFTITNLQLFPRLEVLYLDQSCFWRRKAFWRAPEFEAIMRDGALFRKLLPPSIRQVFLGGDGTPAESPECPKFEPDLLDLARAAREGEFPHLVRLYCTGFAFEAPSALREAFRDAGVDFSLEGPKEKDETFCPMCWVKRFCSAFEHEEYVPGV